ncbi:hypothetical protein HRR83_002330 [Exophiala dermatitidis]|nr:hypothetical protein HRR74_002407 [Exophiala dermatitidis]KAJ4525518.1 hypothetical protein HRR73_002248 [Exophiala dermatitidis]KAJ4536835.1 hypothetical protein HRR76_004861 [Exophiala dermatitidis]KAJ4555564.1 hypothetical protein HRR77_001494 [Exophiala dermatitidis]KAJ4568868.1 hypothetical protein HRR81_006525 [Exophiala dermatitidis]
MRNGCDSSSSDIYSVHAGELWILEAVQSINTFCAWCQTVTNEAAPESTEDDTQPAPGPESDQSRPSPPSTVQLQKSKGSAVSSLVVCPRNHSAVASSCS